MANREIDDVYRRISSPDSYKNRVFEGKRSVTDEYTGERIFYGNQSNARGWTRQRMWIMLLRLRRSGSDMGI